MKKSQYKLFKWNTVKDPTVEKLLLNNRLHFINQENFISICGKQFKSTELNESEIYLSCPVCRKLAAHEKPPSDMKAKKDLIPWQLYKTEYKKTGKKK